MGVTLSTGPNHRPVAQRRSTPLLCRSYAPHAHSEYESKARVKHEGKSGCLLHQARCNLSPLSMRIFLSFFSFLLPVFHVRHRVASPPAVCMSHVHMRYLGNFAMQPKIMVEMRHPVAVKGL